MLFKITARWSNDIRAEVEIGDAWKERPIRDQRGEAVRQALKAGSNLRDSDLRDSDLSGSNLSGSNLRDSDLRDSDLSGSNLRGSDLRGSDLRDSNLRDSDLSGSNLRDSDLRDSDLRGSDLRGSNLRDSDLSGSNLRDSDLRDSDLRDSKNLPLAVLSDIRNDMWDVLLRARGEAPALLGALRDGKVNGSTYTGSCACLVGTIANARGVNYSDLGNGLSPNSGRPAEMWFLGIKEGDTPENSQIAKIAADWVEEFIRLTGPVPAAA